MDNRALRTRFAPSPTGSLHVGGVRTALYNLLCARQSGGTFVLRIEDTDQIRSTEEAAKGLVRDLRWLGLLWDEGPERDHERYGPYYQSQRLDMYSAFARQLVEKGLAYEAWETAEELGAERKIAEAAKQDFRYRRRPYTSEQIERFRAEGRKPVIRLASPGHEVVLDDKIKGPVRVEGEELDDFVLIKADGFPTYHFAVVIDDHHMEIDLVIRGEEHLKNTHKHLLLYEAFGWTPPAHAHLPLIFNPQGGKMSKRDKAKTAREAAKKVAGGAAEIADRTELPLAEISAFMDRKNDAVSTAEAIAEELGVDLPMIEVMDFRKRGFLPEALVNYLSLLGWAPGDGREILSVDDMIASFSFDRVNTTAARFDPKKLDWMNAEYMKSMPEDRLLERLEQWASVTETAVSGLDLEQRRRLLGMYRRRATTFNDLERLGRFLFTAPSSYDPKQVSKHLGADGQGMLKAAREALATVSDWSAPSVRAALEAASSGAGIARVAQPVRIALTGDGVSPEIDLSLEFLGKGESLTRIDRALAAISG